MKLIDDALNGGRSQLSEYESKQVLASYGLPVTDEKLAKTPEELIQAAADIGYPLVIKACSADIAHKTEKGLIRVDVRNDEEALAAFDEIGNCFVEDISETVTNTALKLMLENVGK